VKKISLIFPVYNEEHVLPVLYERVRQVIEQLDYETEVILINDGSQDGSLTLMRQFHQTDPRFKVLDFSRNFGHQTAITAGIDFATGDAVILMDADLQDPPELLPQFLRTWNDGYQVVYGIRKARKENIFKRMAYAAFYRLLQKVSDISIPLDAGDFCLMDRVVVDTLKSMPEKNRFVRGLRSWSGFSQIGLEYERAKRYSGEVKYTLSKLMKLAFDGIFSFSYFPLQMASYAGFGISAICFLAILVYLYKKLFIGGEPPGFPTMVILILFMGGIQLIFLGVLGEYIGRIYDEVKKRPTYVLRGIYGLNSHSKGNDSNRQDAKTHAQNAF
jgi:polyisoprenyl-phosphate glycosyltransferase